MHKTRPLGSLKDLFPRIHQPLPLNERESRRLLDTIKTSFRTQLDKEHGRVAPDLDPVSRLLKAPIVAPPSSATPLWAAAPVLRGSARAADQHMRAILNNPLFSPVEVESVSDRAPDELDKHKAMFERAVSRGLMTLPRATGFLKQVIKLTRPPQALGLRAGFYEPKTGAGLLVLEWLRSSGQERDLAFLANLHFRSALVRCLIADGLENVVWAWLNRLLEAARESNDPQASTAERLIEELVFATSQARDLALPFGAILKAETMVKETKSPSYLLRKAWDALALRTTIPLGPDPRLKPPAHLFDPFVVLGQVIEAPMMKRAHVDLHHPINPSSTLAIQFLSSKECWEYVDELRTRGDSADDGRGGSALPTTKRLARLLFPLKSLGLDTVRHLRETDQAQEASRIWNLLEGNLGSLPYYKRIAV